MVEEGGMRGVKKLLEGGDVRESSSGMSLLVFKMSSGNGRPHLRARAYMILKARAPKWWHVERPSRSRRPWARFDAARSEV